MSPKFSFDKALNIYKNKIDISIAEYAASARQSTEMNYGFRSLAAVEPYLAILEAGGKRLRGALVMAGYQMMGGQNKKMILQAARAIEMLHAYVLIVDDIQDRSLLRRGSPTAHKLIEELHIKNSWKDEPEHIGIALGINSALIGGHAAQMTLANLDVSDDLRIKVMNITNHTLAVTLHGQTNDLLNAIAGDVTPETIDNVMQWKTAHYSFLNPIHVGMVLAGAPCEDTNAITDYALNAGKAFQVTDDLLIFSHDRDSLGKDPIDDVREGKQTLCTVYAYKKASQVDQVFLNSALGNKNLTEQEFKRFKQILIESGAVDHCRSLASEYAERARTSLDKHKDRWNSESVTFLDELAAYILTRTK